MPPTLLQLTTKRDNARKALASALTPKERSSATAEFEKATLALATFQARMAAKSKTRITVATEEEEEDEDEDEDEEADEESDDEPKKPMTDEDSDEDDSDDDDDGDDDDGDDDDDDSDEGEDEEDEDEDEEEDEEARASALASARRILRSAKKSKDKAMVASARANLATVKRAVSSKSASKFKALTDACRRVTGKKSFKAILGGLDALAATSKATEKLSADLARMKSAARRDKVDAMLSSARREGKISRDEVKTLRADGMRQGTKWLRAHLDVRPKLVRSSALEGRTLEGGKEGDAEKTRANALDAQNMSHEQRKIIETFAAGAGKSFDDFVADMNKTRARRA